MTTSKAKLALKRENQTKARVVLSYYWHIIRRYPRYVSGALATIPIAIIVNGFIPPLIVAGVIQKLSSHSYTHGVLWHEFGPTILLYFAVVLIGIVTWRFVDYFMWRLEINAQQDIAEEVFGHLLERSADFHANHFGGSLVSQNNKLLTSYVRIFDTTAFQVIPMIVSIIATIVILLPKAPYFVLALSVLAITYLVAAIVISEPIRRIAAKWSVAESKQTGFLADAVTNVMTIKSYARSHYEKERFHGATTTTRNHAFSFARKHQVQMNTFGIIGRTTQGVAFALAIMAVVLWKSDVSVVFLIISYTSTIAEHLFRFGNDSMRAYNRSFGDAYDMANILSETPEVLEPEKPEVSRIHRGEIVFDNVIFTHNGASDALFKELSLVIKPGEKIGLVGHSGSGKTTFTRLLMRFSDIDSGEILIDGQNIAHITQDDLHAAIAFVPQEPMLFHRTLAENIGYGNLPADIEAIKKAADMANASEFIAQLPDGFDTLVGERGVKLSGGQRQRVAIARAMLKDAPILVLDEATSALDSESEALIQKALWKLMEGRTTIAIAHRLSTIQKMDRIIVMDNGRLVETGSHRELLDRGGTYAKLWARQSGGFIEE
jgi:ATP-binding cassette subfamily B protein